MREDYRKVRGKEGCHVEAITVIPVRMVGLQQAGSSGGSKNWLDILYISKVDRQNYLIAWISGVNRRSQEQMKGFGHLRGDVKEQVGYTS